MDKRLVLLDVDETVIDTKYRLTVEENVLRTALREAEYAGLEIGLNSDSALPSMLARANEWGITGPLLAEKCVVHIQGKKPVTVPIHAHLSEFTAMRSAFLEKLGQMEKADPHFQILAGDANAIVSSLEQCAELRDDVDTLVIVNTLRGHSLSCFTRRKHGERWVIDTAATHHVRGVLTGVGKSFTNLWIDTREDANPEYGIIILHHKDSHKRTAVSHLLSLRQYKRVYMIGDSYADYLGDPRVVQCAVANAHPSYREECAIIATKERTEGVIELLKKIASEP